VASLAFFLSSLSAHAQTQGVLIKGKDTRGGQTTVIEIRLDKNRFQTDLTAAGERFQAIFDGNKALFVQLNLSRKTYTEISKPELDRVVTETIRQTMANLTPEQQARINLETFLNRNAPTNIVPLIREFFPFSKDKVGEWPCTNYAPPGGAIICAADPALFGLTAADFDVLRQLEEFQLALMGGAGAAAPGRGVSISPAGNVFVSGLSEGKPFTAVVLKRTESANSARASTFEVTEIRRETLPQSLFEIPSDFEKQIAVPDIPIRPRR
jgi:hypothetical protein